VSNSAKVAGWIAGGILLLILLFTSYSSGHMMGAAGIGARQEGMMDGSGGFTTLWMAWMFAPALFWGAAVVLVGWLLARLIGDSRSEDSVKTGYRAGSVEPQDPATIAARRLATGEIEVEDYERIMSTIQAHAPTPASPGQIQTG
jgi:uncharacterized membrane protein